MVLEFEISKDHSEEYIVDESQVLGLGHLDTFSLFLEVVFDFK